MSGLLAKQTLTISTHLKMIERSSKHDHRHLIYVMHISYCLLLPSEIVKSLCSQRGKLRLQFCQECECKGRRVRRLVSSIPLMACKAQPEMEICGIPIVAMPWNGLCCQGKQLE